MAQGCLGVDLYLFDSFEGLSAPAPEDATDSGDKRTWESGDLRAAEQDVRANLASFDNVHLMKGWIPERFSEVESERFRLVHIDVDLYEPTLLSIEFFYPRMSDGGVIVLDDYGSSLCPGAKQAVDEFMEDRPETVVHLTTMQGIITRREKAY